MFSDSEAQRVIAISLGKIANCRNQRVSSSLHKNLLVANVLQKVRTFVSEDERPFRWEQQFEQCAIEEKPEHMIVEIPRENSENHELRDPVAYQHPMIACGGSHVSKSESVSDTVNGSVSAVKPDVKYECSIPKNFNQCTDKQGLTTNKDLALPARCLKRRKAVEDSNMSYAKRRKYDDDTLDDLTWRVPPVIVDYESETDSDILDLDQEPSSCNQGDTMDVEQICSLVSVFKCSFKGLGIIENSSESTNSTNSSTDFAFSNNSSFVQELANHNGEAKSPLRRGMSLPDLCAKQADMLCQKFQLAAPVLALTV